MVPRTHRFLVRDIKKIEVSYPAADAFEMKAADSPLLEALDVETTNHKRRMSKTKGSETTALPRFDHRSVLDTSVPLEVALPSPPSSTKPSTPKNDGTCISQIAAISSTPKARRSARQPSGRTLQAKAPPTPRSPPPTKTARSTSAFSLPPHLAIVKSKSLQKAYLCKRAEDKSLADPRLHFGMRLLSMKMLRLDPVTQEEMFWEDFGGLLDENGAFAAG